MQILLSYSRRHFDPDSDLPDQFAGSSAHILARALYEVLAQHGDVTYIDTSEYNAVAGRRFDLFVGQITNFSRVLDVCTVVKSICFMVNMHLAHRNELLLTTVAAEKLPVDAVAPWDLADLAEYERSLDAADFIVAVGNIAVYNSFVTRGVPRRKIKVINYGVGDAAAESHPVTGEATFLHLASEIGLRKGFDIVRGIAERAIRADANFRLDVVGAPTTQLYRQQVEELASRYPKSVTDHGWIDVQSDRYEEVLGRASFIIAPSLEEGQSGAVLDAMRVGIIPILTQNAGVDFSPLGWLESDFTSARNDEIIRSALALDPESRQQLRSATLNYYREYHQDFQPALAEAIAGCLAGKLYPKMSVTLPIFNKAETIVPLLEYLDRAASAYGNVELHVIFDGCVDDSPKKVREFFDVDRGYPVSFEETPDIFEVKTNNIGLRKSTGKYCVIMQDDNYIYDENLFFETAIFLDKNPSAAVLGTLAGVNFYPIGTQLSGAGHIAMSGSETYWRQDAETDPRLVNKFFQVDACMRGPLLVRNSFLREHGYLDEIYAPMYMDDMDLGFRVALHGSKVYCMLGAVENASLTMAHYNVEQNNRFGEVLRRNTQTFYERWSPGHVKDYSQCERIQIAGGEAPVTRLQAGTSTRFLMRRRLGALRRSASTVLQARRVLDSEYCEKLSGTRRRQQRDWLTTQAARLPEKSRVLGIGAGARYYSDCFSSHDFVAVASGNPERPQALDHSAGQLAFSSEYADAIVCMDAFPDELSANDVLAEAARLLKPGGRLIFSASRSSDWWGDSDSGLSRSWYERSFAQQGLRIITLQPNAGLFAHVIELLWHGRDVVVNAFSGGNIVKRTVARALQVGLFNLPTLGLSMLEDRWLLEDFTAAFLCVAEKSDRS